MIFDYSPRFSEAPHISMERLDVFFCQNVNSFHLKWLGDTSKPGSKDATKQISTQESAMPITKCETRCLHSSNASHRSSF